MNAALRRWRLLTQPYRKLMHGRSAGGRYCPPWCKGDCHVPIEGIDADDLVAIHNGQPFTLTVSVDTEVHEISVFPTRVDSLRRIGAGWVHVAGATECDMTPEHALRTAQMLIDAARIAMKG